MKPAPAQLAALARRDPALGRALRRVAPFPGFPDGAARVIRSHFHALARSIVYQQLAGAAARTIHDRVAALTPSGRFPTATELLGLPEQRLRGAGLSRSGLGIVTNRGSIKLGQAAGALSCAFDRQSCEHGGL